MKRFSLPSSSQKIRQWKEPSKPRSAGSSPWTKKKHPKGSFWCHSMPTIESMHHLESQDSSHINLIEVGGTDEDEDKLLWHAKAVILQGNRAGTTTPNIADEDMSSSYTLASPHQLATPKKHKRKRWLSTSSLFSLKTNNGTKTPRSILQGVKAALRISKKDNLNTHNIIVDGQLCEQEQFPHPVALEHDIGGERTDVMLASMDFDKQKDPFITFRLRILLKSGHNLAIRDASGSSDPYCKFKYKNQVIYKSNVIFKNLNPIWEEEFSFLIDDPTEMIQIEAYDHDRFMSDDFLGGLSLNLSYFTLSQEYDLKLDLEAGPSSNDIDEDLGYLAINLMIEPFTQNERDLFLSKSSRGVIAKNNLPTKSLKPAQIWYAVLNVVLAEAHLNCLSMSNESVKPSPYVKFRLGQEKYKSKVCQQTLAPQWLEQFDLHIFDEENHMLELCVLDKVSNVVLAKGSIKVSDIKKEETNENWLVLDDEKGSVLLLLSKSGSSVTEGSIQNKSEFEKEATMTKYSLFKSLENLSDVGHLTVKIFKAEGLAAADLNFKSDPYIVVELDNSRLQTHTEYKTLNPTFNKMFTFNVKDIHSILSFTVYDEDPNKKAEFLGKINIPLLSIKNGTKKWYGLKDIDLKNRAKGQIYIEMEVIWNPFRAAIRTFNPRERKLIAKKPTFQKQKLIRDINSLKAFYKTIAEYSDFVSSIFNWDNPIKSILSMVIFLISVYYIQMFHLPMILVFILLKNYMKLKVSRSNGFYVSLLNLSNYNLSATHQPLSQQDSIDDTDLTEDKQSKGNVVAAWRNVVFSLGDHLVLIQESIHYIVSLLERVINALNFSVPYISITAIAVLSLISLLLFLIPLRWIVMIWGINKFTKKLRNPHFIPNNEVLDFLSRVPSETEKVMYSEYNVKERTSSRR